MDGSIDNVIALIEPGIGSAAGLFAALIESLNTLSGAGAGAELVPGP